MRHTAADKMTTEIENLTREVHKIVTAPYLVSLKRLHSILEDYGEQSGPILQHWARIHGDEIPRLASAVVQGLSQWPYVFEVLERLSSVTSLRDALLGKSPTILSQLLDKAVQSDDAFERHCNICLALLQEPLGPQVALPQSAQVLLWKFFEKAVQNPNAATVEPVYLLLDGACGEILGILPKEGLEKLRSHLTKIMRTVKGIEEQLVSLFCLAIISKTMCERNQPSKSTLNLIDNQVSNPHPETAQCEAEKFFVGDRALKTIHLLALQVIYACRHENEASEAQKIKPVRLAREILAAIRWNYREKWTEINPSISRKLQEKIGHEHLPKSLRFEAFTFMSMLFSDASSLQISIISSYQQTLLSLDSTAYSWRHLEYGLSTTLPFFARRLDQRFWMDFFKLFLEKLNQTDQNAILPSELLLCSLKITENTCLSCSVTRKNVIDAVSSSDIIDILERITVQKATDRDLGRSLFASLLRIGAATLKDEPTFQTSFILTLVTKLQEFAHTSACDPFNPTNTVQTVHLPLIELAATPEGLGASHQWQERLAFELRSEAKHCHESIIRFIGHVCRDLEDRCEHVEEPLRAKQVECNEMADERSKCQARVKELETGLADFKADFIALEAAKSRTESERTDAEAELMNMNQKYRDLKELLQHTKDGKEHELLAMRHDFESQKLALQATIACHVEKLDEHAADIDDLMLRVTTAESDAKEERERTAKLRDSLEEISSNLNRSLSSEKSKTLENERLLEHSRECREALETKISFLESQIEKNKESYEERLTKLRSEHENSMRSVQAGMALQQQTLEKRLEEITDQLAQAKEQYEADVQKQEQDNQDLQRRMESCMKDCQEKTTQLREAKQMKSRLLSTMGVYEENLVSCRREQDLHWGYGPVKDETRKQDVDFKQPKALGIEPRTQFSRREASPMPPSGSSPKRAKARASFQAPRVEAGRSVRLGQMEYNVRDRRSIDGSGLEDASANSLNQKDVSRRQSENIKPLAHFVNLESSSQGETSVVSAEQASEEVAPVGQENSKKFLNTSDSYFDGLAAEDFEGSTVEL